MKRLLSAAILFAVLVQTAGAGISFVRSSGITLTGADGITLTGADGITLTGADGILNYTTNGITLTVADGVPLTGLDAVRTVGTNGVIDRDHGCISLVRLGSLHYSIHKQQETGDCSRRLS